MRALAVALRAALAPLVAARASTGDAPAIVRPLHTFSPLGSRR